MPRVFRSPRPTSTTEPNAADAAAATRLVTNDARPTILLTGAGGQRGRELAAILPAHAQVVSFDRTTLDLAEDDAIVTKVRALAPAVIVNAAAYTAVDKAEQARDDAFAINARAPGVLADEARRAGALLVHYSTDYVFDGERDAPYSEDDEVNPLNVYGASKLEGERAIAASGAPALILRTSWVYARHGQNFLTTMQRLAGTRGELRVVADQTGVPNWARGLARATAALVASGIGRLRERAGLYHLSATGATTWYDFARAILCDRPDVRVVPIATADYPTAARRPKHAVLDASRFARTFDIALPAWDAQLRECLDSPADPPLRGTE
jgi:dTDP-4-dehydrorhamnose reductase